MADLTLTSLLIILLAAFIPSLLLMLIVRNTERRNREPTGRTFRAFLGGATLSIALAIILEAFLIDYVLNLNFLRVSELLGQHPMLGTLLLACVIAPLVEEMTKALGIVPFARRAKELEDGIVYGAAVGLGFAATENLLYEVAAYITFGVDVLVGTIILRTISSALLHASTSSITGYGLTAKKFIGSSWLPYYFIAALLHGTFNLAASAGPLLEPSIGESGYFISLGVAVTMAVSAFSWSRRKIRSLERQEMST